MKLDRQTARPALPAAWAGTAARADDKFASTLRQLAISAWPASLSLLALLTGCSSTPPIQWYELRSAAPVSITATATTAGTAAAAAPDTTVWAVSPRVTLPGALDRDMLMLARGSAGLEALPGHRWAEPLRDSVPRLLLADLQRLRGSERVWAAPVPTGVMATRRLSVAIEQFQVTADRNTLELTAVALWQDGGAAATTATTAIKANPATATTPVTSATSTTAAPAAAPTSAPAPSTAPAPQTQRIELQVRIASASVDAVAAAHRLALWQLAQRLAAGPPLREALALGVGR